MNEQNDDAQNFALMVLAAVVALVIAAVLALAISASGGARGGAAAKAGAAAASAVAGTASGAATGESSTAADAGAAVPELGAADGRVYFDVGSDALTSDAQAELARVADAARAEAGKVVLISGFHDESGDAAKNAELAKNRALAVRRALEASGVAHERLVMDKPRVTLGGADAREARRVEMRLR
jgi:outer membrane protein OmpA-like peptidoglycan-associated protein